MSAPTPASAAAFEDALGQRRRSAAAGGDAIETLTIRTELTAVPAFEFSLRERASRVAAFRHPSFAQVRCIDRVDSMPPTLALVSDAPRGVRLASLFAAVPMPEKVLDIHVAMHLVRQLVAAVAALHEVGRDVAHGAIGLDRLLVTPDGSVVVTEYVLGAALEQLHFSHQRCWKELRIAVPPSPGLPRFDQRADVAQIGVVALSLVLGRTLTDDEYPARIADVVGSAWSISARGGLEPLPPGLRTWLWHALQLDTRRAFANAIDAKAALEKVIAGDEGGRAIALPGVAAPAAGAGTVKTVRDDGHGATVRLKPDATTEVRLKSDATPGADDRGGRLKSDATPGADDRGVRLKSDATPGADDRGGRLKSDATPGANDRGVRLKSDATPVADPLDARSDSSPRERQDVMPGQVGSRRRAVAVAAAVVALVGLSTAGVLGARRLLTPPVVPPATTGTLTVTTNPAGAALFVDGVARGKTPATVMLNAGSHAVELRGAGEPRSMAVTVAAGAQLSQYIELPADSAAEPRDAQGKPAAGATAASTGPAPAAASAVPVESQFGWVSVAAPVELQIFENQRLLGTSRTDRIMVAAGRHDLEVVSETLGYRATKTIQVPPGKVAPIKLEWPRGTLSVNALPWAEVWIDGERAGETPIGNVALPIGPHEIVFRHPELGEQRHAATVTLAAPARVSVDLRRKP